MKRTRCPHCKGKLEQGQRIHPQCIDGYAEAQAEKAKRKADKQAALERKETRGQTASMFSRLASC